MQPYDSTQDDLLTEFFDLDAFSIDTPSGRPDFLSLQPSAAPADQAQHLPFSIQPSPWRLSQNINQSSQALQQMNLELEEVELKLKRNEILKRRQRHLLENSGPIQQQEEQIHLMSSQINAASLPWFIETFGAANRQDASTIVDWKNIEDVRGLPKTLCVSAD